MNEPKRLWCTDYGTVPHVSIDDPAYQEMQRKAEHHDVAMEAVVTLKAALKRVTNPERRSIDDPAYQEMQRKAEAWDSQFSHDGSAVLAKAEAFDMLGELLDNSEVGQVWFTLYPATGNVGVWAAQIAVERNDIEAAIRSAHAAMQEDES